MKKVTLLAGLISLGAVLGTAQAIAGEATREGHDFMYWDSRPAQDHSMTTPEPGTLALLGLGLTGLGLTGLGRKRKK